MYRHESPLTLTLTNAPQRSSKAPPRNTLNQSNQGQRTHEYQLKRGKILEFNNFRIVNVIELVSKSQKSHESQRFQGIKFIVDVQW
jgi:hypothetical protein